MTGCSAAILVTGGLLPGSSGMLEGGSTVQVAVGPVDPPAGWVAGEAEVYAAGDEPARAQLQVALPPDGPVPLVTGTPVRIAVLIFLPDTVAPSPVDEARLLSDFGADVTVVTSDLVLERVSDEAFNPPMPVSR
ncbi:MAG: hypothetical protein ACE5I7_16370 [Candidatus Binatia bacterium]